MNTTIDYLATAIIVMLAGGVFAVGRWFAEAIGFVLAVLA